MVHLADGRAGRNVGLYLAQILLGFAKEFFCFAIIGGGFALLGNGLGVRDEVEVVEALLALVG